jgi:GDPmannose 4,6-dehydratase
MRKRAIIIGGSGQDGIEMAIFLKKKNYELISIIRKKNNKIKKILNNKNIFKIADLQNTQKIIKIIKKFKPREIYNFAGISTISESRNKILLNDKVNSHAFLAILENLKKMKFKGKIFQSLSAEVFGDYNYKKINPQRFNPINPYAISKLSSYYYSKYFRKNFGLKIYCGFFFNHDSKYNKGANVIYYVINNFKKILLKKKKSFSIRNVNVRRDWNLATVFIEKIWQILQKKKPCDFILRSGKYDYLEDIVFKVAQFYKIPMKIIVKNNKIIFINPKTKKPIIYSKRIKEKFENDTLNILDFKIGKKNKILNIVKNIDSYL